MIKHTQKLMLSSDDDGLWEIYADENGSDLIATCLMYADASRIVDCWNACAGLGKNPAAEIAKLHTKITELEIVLADEKAKHPPCLECGAMTARESETVCICSGDKDHCHGVELWGGDDELEIDKLRADNKVLRDAMGKAHSFDVAGMTYFDGYYQLKIILDEALEQTKETE